jgi:hypothetical protein
MWANNMENNSVNNLVLAEKISNISGKINNIDEQLFKINETINTLAILGVKQNTILEQQEKILEQNTESLKEHMRRTDLLERDTLQFKSVIGFIKWGVGILVSGGVALVIKFFFGV